MSSEFLIHDDGQPDATALQAEQHALGDLPVDVLVYLLGSRYCETDRLSETAWALFGKHPKGWPLVKAICDYVHDRIAFGYAHASPFKTAWDAHNERHGVCRDFAHLAITMCRCMNIPARYCTGYLGDIGVPADPNPMDFSGGSKPISADAGIRSTPLQQKPRIGRILIARGCATPRRRDGDDLWPLRARQLQGDHGGGCDYFQKLKWSHSNAVGVCETPKPVLVEVHLARDLRHTAAALSNSA